jgi:hypothetical protein
MAEILFAAPDDSHVYHLENPLRQSWADVMGFLSQELKISQVVPFKAWLEKVSQAPETENPATQLLNFFSHEFEHNASGEVVMDTAHSRAASACLAKMKVVEPGTIQSYLASWKEVGFLA